MSLPRASLLLAAALVLGSAAAGAQTTLGSPPPGTMGPVHLNREFLARLVPPAPRRHPLSDVRGRLPLVIDLAPGETARDRGFQPYGPGFATARVFPGELEQFERDHPGVRYSVWPPLHVLLDESAKLNRTNDYRAALAASGSPIAGTGRGVVVGVIDTGIDGQHPDFLDAAGHSRVAWLLDLSKMPIGRHPELEAEFGCNDTKTPCAVEDSNDIDEALAGGTATFVPRDLVGHGTHVASIAAGNDRIGGRYVGGAPEASLVVAAVTHGPLGEVTDPDIANGARFIFDRAAAMGQAAVLNLSLGSDFGPHDGSTPLETTLSSLVGATQPGRAIVVAVGNSGALYQGRTTAEILGIHTQLRVTLGAVARAPLLSPGRATDPTLTGTTLIWITYGTADGLAIGLSGPHGVSIAPTEPGQQASFTTSDGALEATVYNGVDDPSLPLRADAHGAIAVWTGAWPAGSEFALDFHGNGFAEAWVATSLDGGDPDTMMFEHALLQGTVNVPATQRDLIAVGCTVNRTQWTDADQHPHDATALLGLGNLQVDGTCNFSSAGPSTIGAAKPEISAPGALVAAAMSKDAVPGPGRASIFDAPLGFCPDNNPCLVVDANHALLSGSSMSSPQVAGAVALLFERNASLTQPDIARLLQQGARRPAGSVFADFQLGGGALDVQGSVAALDGAGANVVPDPAASFMSLSDGFVHPDSGWSTTGTVQLRALDGSIADGFDPARLTLEVSETGFVKTPLARVAAGLWRFEVGARPGTGQDVLTVAVRFDGTPLGTSGSRLGGVRTVPIGADRWVAAEVTLAHGGCGLASPGAPGPGAGTMAVALTALAMGIAHRRSLKGAGRRSTHSRVARKVCRRDRRARRDEDPPR